MPGVGLAIWVLWLESRGLFVSLTPGSRDGFLTPSDAPKW